MAEDKVLIVCPTLATLRKNIKRGKVKETLLLIKIKPKGKTQEIKVRCRRTPKGKYVNEWGNHSATENKLWKPEEDTKGVGGSLDPSVLHETTFKTHTHTNFEG